MGRLLPYRVAILALVVLLGACSGPTIYKQNFAANYRHQDIMADHLQQGMLVEVLGSYKDVPESELAPAIAAAMDGKNEGLPIPFSAKPQDQEQSVRQVTVLFNPSVTAMGHQVCQNTALPGTTGDPDAALIVYCKRGQTFSELWMTLPEGAQPGNPAFTQAFASAARTLLPIQPPMDRPDGCGIGCRFKIGM